jgi:hypothetical protein
MVIRFVSKAPLLRFGRQDDRLESHPSGLNRLDARRLSRREIVHRERMLQHLARLERRQ